MHNYYVFYLAFFIPLFIPQPNFWYKNYIVILMLIHIYLTLVYACVLCFCLAILFKASKHK